MPAIANRLVQRLEDSGLASSDDGPTTTRARIYRDKDIPRSESACGIIILRPVAFDVTQQMRVSLHRTGPLLQATLAHDLVLPKMFLLGFKRIPAWLLLSAITAVIPLLAGTPTPSGAGFALILILASAVALAFGKCFLQYRRFIRLAFLGNIGWAFGAFLMIGLPLAALNGQQSHATASWLVGQAMWLVLLFLCAVCPLNAWRALDFPGTESGQEHNVVGFRNAVAEVLDSEP